MFSRGNITEKIRVASLVQPGERVLDLYGGIGYFTLPALVHGRAAHVVACEWNKDAVDALQFNLRDNQVEDRATVLKGDCRRLAEEHRLVHEFDRVILGLLPSSEGGWSTAVKALRLDTGGWLHIHGNVPVREALAWLEWLCVRLKEYLGKNDIDCELYRDWIVLGHHLEKVKSFAPTVNHYVADVYLGPRSAITNIFVTKYNCEPGFVGFVDRSDLTVRECQQDVLPPSCALSPTGPLHQGWMR
jgi:tRNA G37 N-methylase Trm5